MRLRHIEIFQAILQTGSVTGAASLLNVSQPAASKALQHAEAQLGFTLFKRVRGQLLPTPEARILEQSTARVFEELQRARRLAGGLRQQSARSLRVVATPSLAQSLLPKVIPRWMKRFPGVPYELATHHTPELVENLLLHESDLALTLQDPKHAGLSMRTLAQGQMVVIAPPGHWPIHSLDEPLDIQELGGEPLLALDTRDALGSLLDHHLGEAPQPPQVVARVQTWLLARSLVAEGLGLAVVDPLTGYGPGAPIQVRALRPMLPVKFYALTRPDEGTSEALEGLLEELSKEAAGLMG
ncbi:LysR substrate-binding domain-containing protein [Pseudomonas berkeleyensis]|uniref:LysR family transcriptional regulator n=1 Tax=Pseudomonas berkeleyensis TaxID=2726956 RepID=A0A7G5DNI5_9PSED|nr:LysR substrate-binding domain-containing protein [Pseudomonas berkeleyensis]QMV63310.1 LysR family transcriptional regulator [Pseudomonas berkeleyensis]WSO38768.1 LysR substrate-binding domain-containing protein [Pseudomonas berkeleyensis]